MGGSGGGAWVVSSLSSLVLLTGLIQMTQDRLTEEKNSIYTYGGLTEMGPKEMTKAGSFPTF